MNVKFIQININLNFSFARILKINKMNKLFGVLFLFLKFLMINADDYGIPEVIC